MGDQLMAGRLRPTEALLGGTGFECFFWDAAAGSGHGDRAYP